MRALLDTRAGTVLVASTLAIAIFTAVGLAVLWPGGDVPGADTPPTLPAEVTATATEMCPGGTGQECRTVTLRVDDENAPGGSATITVPLGPAALTPDFATGDDLRVTRIEGAPADQAYAIAERERRTPLVLLAVIFAVLIVLMARWRGVLALGGFALSLFLVVEFLVPAMLSGDSPVLVALVGALAVMFVTVVLTYGIGPPSMAAIIGITGALLLASGLGLATVETAHLDGRGTDDAGALLQATGGDISLQGIVLAGMILGALGVLADMAVTQASAVMALRRANPRLGARALYEGAFGIGRDHLVATTHTLVLAYVGATLPLLLLLEGSGVTGGDALNTPDLAEPIVATLVGSIALLVSVPLTTALAAVLVARMPPESLPGSGGHVHHH